MRFLLLDRSMHQASCLACGMRCLALAGWCERGQSSHEPVESLLLARHCPRVSGGAGEPLLIGGSL